MSRYVLQCFVCCDLSPFQPAECRYRFVVCLKCPVVVEI